MPESLEEHLKDLRRQIELALRKYLSLGSDCPERLQAAMSYSVEAGGKRLRPVLVLMACEACGGTIEQALPAAVAVELIHTYSLIHDDLPAMDNDDFRRGRPTNHKQFDEATAILAGDGLLTLAFEIVAKHVQPAAVAAACVADLAAAAGPEGMVAGQMADLLAENAGFRGIGFQPVISSGESDGSSGGSDRLEAYPTSSSESDRLEAYPTSSSESDRLEAYPTAIRDSLSVEELEAIHLRKTGRLLRSPLTMGARIAGADEITLDRLDQFGKCVGLAFQITDDLLDMTGDATKMGKAVRKDAALGKLTYPGLLGLDESRRRAERLIETACCSIAPLGDRGQRLDALARFVLERDH